MKTRNITIIGTGAYGTCLANVLTDNGHDVVMYGIVDDQVNDLMVNHQNKIFFGELKLNEKIKATTDLSAALEKTEILILGVPTKALLGVIQQIIPLTKKELIVVNTAKGLDYQDQGLLSTAIKKAFQPSGILKGFAAIYGPSIASEVANRLPTGVNVASDDMALATDLAQVFSNEYFKAVESDDVAGCEVAAALKNAVAIGAGILDGLKVGDNARASLITKGLGEIYQIASLYHAKAETFLNYAGLGDLILTATSPKSRNYSLGVKIAQDNDPQKTLGENTKTVEGVLAVKIAYEICQREKIHAEVFTNLYEILYNLKRPIILVNNFLK